MKKTALKQRAAAIIDHILPEITALRHNLHQHPELAGEEFATAELVRNTLKFTDIELLPPFLETDVVGILHGAKSGSNVALRADMDALPLNELTNLPYKSVFDGKMHACGHDGHTAILVGTAIVLNELRESLSGTVRFIFQPGEEELALGKKLVEAGVLKTGGPEADAVFALHAFNQLPVGTISSRPGPMMAAAGFFRIRVVGRGGHGARPESAIDPILTGSKIVEALQSIVARNVSPQDAAVVSVCRFEAGKNANVIPEEALIEGTIRFLKPETEKILLDAMQRIVKGIGTAMNAKCELDYRMPYIPTINHADFVEMARCVTHEYCGNDKWIETPVPSMGGEDFSFYLREYPGVFCRLGIGEDVPGIHHPQFDFNDEALRNGMLFFVGMTLAAQLKIKN